MAKRKRSPASRRGTRRAARPAAGRTRSKLTRTAAARKPAQRKPARAAAGAPNVIGMLVQHVDYTSQALDEVRRFYTELLGFGRFEHDPKSNYLNIVTGPSSSLGFMPPMEGPPDQWRPPREPALYFAVRDVDRAYAELKRRGVTFDQAPQDMFWGHRVALLKDPEGRRICLAQEVRR